MRLRVISSFQTYRCLTTAGDVCLAVLVEGAVLKSDDATRWVGGARTILDHLLCGGLGF